MSLLGGLFGQSDYGASQMGTPLGGTQLGAGMANQIGAMQAVSPAQYNQMLAQQRRVQAGTLQRDKVFDPNKHEAFQIPLSQLVTMWRLKYDNRWIKPLEEFPRFDGEFYAGAFDRMSALCMFETYQGWFRLKEDA